MILGSLVTVLRSVEGGRGISYFASTVRCSRPEIKRLRWKLNSFLLGGLETGFRVIIHMKVGSFHSFKLFPNSSRFNDPHKYSCFIIAQ